MSHATLDSFYRLTFDDAFRGGEAIADAFADDPLWLRLFEGESDLPRRYQACFEVPVRHCLKYGRVYATSEALEGVAAFVPGAFSDMSFWRMLRSGAVGCGMRMGMTAALRMANLRVLSKDRAKVTAGRPFVHLSVLGVRKAHQGKGLGGALLRALIEDCEKRCLPTYLETETEENVRMYERFGFELLKQVDLPNLGLPMWEMMREPGRPGRGQG
ncbi:MAG: GNAT family N-acetyltransferase [Thermoleophilia bacterium]|nr:GNAT family N-acetyltransferase [Thermoleophilia bacterium]